MTDQNNKIFNAIEIPDSDEDMLEPTTTTPESINSSSDTVEEQTPEKKMNLSVSSTTDTDDTAVDKSPESTSAETATTNSSDAAHATAQGRHRSRKMQHTVRNAAENEIQFETIPLDDDDSSRRYKMETKPEDVQMEKKDEVQSIIDEMLNMEDVEANIQRIANERVRCNFLLATYQLPDLNFSLNSHLDMLKYEFRLRLKERREHVNATIPSEASDYATSLPKLTIMSNPTINENET